MKIYLKDEFVGVTVFDMEKQIYENLFIRKNVKKSTNVTPFHFHDKDIHVSHVVQGLQGTHGGISV